MLSISLPFRFTISSQHGHTLSELLECTSQLAMLMSLGLSSLIKHLLLFLDLGIKALCNDIDLLYTMSPLFHTHVISVLLVRLEAREG